MASGFKFCAAKQQVLNTAIGRYPDATTTLKFYVSWIGGEVAENPAITAAGNAVPAKPESFAIARAGDDIAIVGRDETGAMYGCFELAERLDMKGPAAFNIDKTVVQSPAVEFRAVNPFITTPYKETDAGWYFLQEDYWEGYLDLLARR